MKINEDLVLIGDRVALVPYKPEHVPTYHEWMKSPFLQEMTASEPLSLDEEYAMQKSWHQDEEKLTFIVTALPLHSSYSTLKDIPPKEIKKNTVMIGDVNLFFNDTDLGHTYGEIEIMIAEDQYRQSGRGVEALKMMMAYALEVIGVLTFHAKISLKNEPSIRLFQSKLGFYEVSRSKIFGEVTLEWTLLSSKDEDSFGFKCTPDQRTRIETMKQELTENYKALKQSKWSLCL
ncbi:GNAT domain-containing protein [Pilobolus umbonatus]|nr:GNAT domain-containing protein [Pilobolus umbonatus]